MPTYDYLCTCGHSFEKFQWMSEKKLKECPKCKEKKLKRLAGGGAAVIFKGKGFLCNDYPKKK